MTQQKPKRRSPHLSPERLTALQRNWKILRLRGLYDAAELFTTEAHRELLQEMVEHELRRMGAESEKGKRKTDRPRLKEKFLTGSTKS